MYKSFTILCFLSFSITIKAIDFNLFPALFDVNNTLLSKQCRKQLVSGEILCTKANVDKWTENGVIPGIKNAEQDGLTYLQEYSYDQYHCCGAWDLSDCIKRFVKLKCSKIDYQIIVELIEDLHDQLSQNMCSDFLRGSKNCIEQKMYYKIDLAKLFIKMPHMYPGCRRLIEIREKTCVNKADREWLKSDIYLEFWKLARDDPDSDRFFQLYEQLKCCVLWDSLDCMIQIIEGECDIDQDLIDVTVKQIEANHSQPGITFDCSLYPRHSIECQLKTPEDVKEQSKKVRP